MAIFAPNPSSVWVPRTPFDARRASLSASSSADDESSSADDEESSSAGDEVSRARADTRLRGAWQGRIGTPGAWVTQQARNLLMRLEDEGVRARTLGERAVRPVFVAESRRWHFLPR